MDLLVHKLLNYMILDWKPLMNSSMRTRQTYDHKFIRSQSCTFVLLRTWKHVNSRCTVYSIATVRTLPWEGIEFGNFILIPTFTCEIILLNILCRRCVWVIRERWPRSSTPDLEFFKRGNKRSLTKWRMRKSRIRTGDPMFISPTL